MITKQHRPDVVVEEALLVALDPDALPLGVRDQAVPRVLDVELVHAAEARPVHHDTADVEEVEEVDVGDGGEVAEDDLGPEVLLALHLAEEHLHSAVVLKSSRQGCHQTVLHDQVKRRL